MPPLYLIGLGGLIGFLGWSSLVCALVAPWFLPLFSAEFFSGLLVGLALVLCVVERFVISAEQKDWLNWLSRVLLADAVLISVTGWSWNPSSFWGLREEAHVKHMIV